ncbi:MAG: Mu transposase C-terminal domain-containing protein [Gaiellaceae bacterium]
MEAALEHLRLVAGRNRDRVPVSAVRATAERFGVKERAVWRWLRSGPPKAFERRSLAREAVAAIAEHHGNRRAAWDALHAAGTYDRSYAQFTRDVNQLTPMMRQGITEGVRGAINQGLYLKASPAGRLDLVVFDHTEADIHLQRVHRGRLETFRPWVSLLVDTGTRFLLNAIVTEGDGLRGDPGTESLVALIGGAIRGQTAGDGTFVGGVPRLVQCDGARAHLADAMLHGYLELGIASRILAPASPWEDGAVERLMRTLSEGLLAKLPGYTAALPDRYGHAPWKPAECLTVEEFTARFELWIDSYNYERIHSALQCTPFEAWRDDPAPVERVPDALIRHGFLAVTQGRTVSKKGVRFRNVDYVHAGLGDLVGKKVSIRYLPNDRSFIDVYDDDEFVCSAEPHNRLSREDRIQIVRDRNARVRSVDRIIKRSRKRIVERELAAAPLLAPRRDAADVLEQLEETSDEFLAFAERAFNANGPAQS